MGLLEDIKEYVSDWHWDDASEKYAFESGKFLFAFLNYLDDQKLSERTKKLHAQNVYFIGTFDAGYGYHEVFNHENFEDGPDYDYQYGRKVSDSESALKLYGGTWRKLDKFIKSNTYQQYLDKLDAILKAES